MGEDTVTCCVYPPANLEALKYVRSFAPTAHHRQKARFLPKSSSASRAGGRGLGWRPWCTRPRGRYLWSSPGGQDGTASRGSHTPPLYSRHEHCANTDDRPSVWDTLHAPHRRAHARGRTGGTGATGVAPEDREGTWTPERMRPPTATGTPGSSKKAVTSFPRGDRRSNKHQTEKLRQFGQLLHIKGFFHTCLNGPFVPFSVEGFD